MNNSKITDKSRINLRNFTRGNCKEHKCSTTTHGVYQRQTERFCKWSKEQGYPSNMTRGRAIEAARSYLDNMRERGMSPSSIHTSASAIACGLGVKMDRFGTISRGLSTKGRDDQGVRTNRNERICSATRDIGIRRSEMARLRGRDLVERDGRLFVIVERGKGGKYQEQLIMPRHEERVRDLFRGVGKDEYVFSREEVQATHEANLHALRREVAQEAYCRYSAMSEEEREPYRQLIKERFEANPNKAEREEYSKIKWDSPYWPRNQELKRQLKANGFDLPLDRFALMATSVLHLSHYRDSVVVKNYLR